MFSKDATETEAAGQETIEEKDSLRSLCESKEAEVHLLFQTLAMLELALEIVGPFDENFLSTEANIVGEIACDPSSSIEINAVNTPGLGDNHEVASSPDLEEG
jgi:hypothetical protein